MNKLSIEDLDLRGKKVLMRVDFNVPIKEGRVDNDKRIVAALPSIRYALDRGAALILMSHLGRPKGEPDPAFSLRPVQGCLAEHLGIEVKFVDDCVGPAAEKAAAALKPGEKNPEKEPGFSDSLARLGDCYVNDAFGTAHRAHSSMVGVAERFEKRAAGFLMMKELEYFSKALSSPAKPFMALLGGAKVSDKILVLDNLLERIDVMLIGGAMAYTFLRARGVPVGSSRVEEDKIDLAAGILAKAAQKDVDVLLPVDHLCGKEFAEETESMVTEDEHIPDGWMGLDLGPKSIAAYAEKLRQAKTVIWNGPMGVFEWKRFSAGTMEMARACAESDAVTIVGGGDSASAAKKSGLGERFSHISTGGGASLELLEGKVLPGVAALTDN